MPDQEEETVTAARMARNFSEYREKALKTPVFISNYGRTTHVLLSVEEFERRSTAEKLDAETYLKVAADLGEWTTGALLICDNNSVIRYINRVASAAFAIEESEATGKSLAACIPGYSGSLMESHAKRTIVSDYPSSADIPAPGKNETWLRFWSYPWHGWNVMSFRDITEHVEMHRLADVKEAILHGMSVHGLIGYVRLSIRGTVQRVDKPFCDVIGLSENKITGTSLLDFVATKARVPFREALERVLGGGETASTTTLFLSNSGEDLPMRCGFVPLKGAFGLEGAVGLFTPCDSA